MSQSQIDRARAIPRGFAAIEWDPGPRLRQLRAELKAEQQDRNRNLRTLLVALVEKRR